MADEVLFLNGEFMPLREGRIPVEDRGFQLGDGVYEALKVLGGTTLWLREHLRRLRRSLDAIRLEMPDQGWRLDEVVLDLVRRAGTTDGLVYMQITRGWAPREFRFPTPPAPTVLAYVRDRVFNSDAFVLAGVGSHPVEDPRWARCDIKSTDLLASVMAKQAAQDAGAYEALFVGPDGVVREGGSSNVFAVVEGVLTTHPADNHILDGITRQQVLRLAATTGVPRDERGFTLDEVGSRAGELFLTSTTNDVLPIVRVGGRALRDGRPGPVTLALADLLRAEEHRLAGLPLPAPLSGQI